MNVQLPILALCALVTGSCAPSTTVQPPAEHAPEPPAVVTTVTVSPALEAVAPACRASELAQANAVDDDCDGRIDQLPNGPGLSVAFSNASAADLALNLVDAQGKSIAASRAAPIAAPCSAPTFDTASFVYDALPTPPAKLVLSHVRSCGEPAPATAAVAIATAQGARTYLVTLEPGATLTLAEIDVERPAH